MARKIALVGIGKIALDQHIPAIANSPDWQLSAAVSRNRQVPGTDHFTDIDSLLAARPDIEVVSLCLPPVPRFDAACSAIRAGRHVMLEKPPGASLSECAILENLAREHGVALFATWHSREAGGVEPARRRLADREPRRVKVTWKEDVRRWHPGQSWIWQPGGMGVFDPGINALSILTKILPHPVRLVDSVLDIPANCATPIAAALTLHSTGGCEICCEFDFREQGEQIWTIEIESDHGVLRLEAGGSTLSIDDSVVSETGPGGLAGEYPRLYANMAKLVASRQIDFDMAPFRIVADAFVLGLRRTVDPFYE